MASMRKAIEDNSFSEFRKKFYAESD